METLLAVLNTVVFFSVVALSQWSIHLLRESNALNWQLRLELERVRREG